MSILLFYISRPAGSNFIYPTEDEEPPPLMDDDAEGGESIVPFGHTHESIDALHRYTRTKVSSDEEPEEDESPDREFSGDGGYLSNMVSRGRGSDYESSPDEHAHCSSGCGRVH
jgi:hypothetical protein